MPAAEDRQARALERIELNTKQIARVMETLNENLVIAFKYLKGAIEQDEADHNPNQMSIDEIRAQAERNERDRTERAEYEARTGETWVDENKGSE